jgi:hypothetical protein
MNLRFADRGSRKTLRVRSTYASSGVAIKIGCGAAIDPVVALE